MMKIEAVSVGGIWWQQRVEHLLLQAQMTANSRFAVSIKQSIWQLLSTYKVEKYLQVFNSDYISFWFWYSLHNPLWSGGYFWQPRNLYCKNRSYHMRKPSGCIKSWRWRRNIRIFIVLCPTYPTYYRLMQYESLIKKYQR